MCNNTKLTLPLEVGKKYVRMDGKIVRIIAIDRVDDFGDNVVGLVDEEKYERLTSLKLNGSHGCDLACLIADYVEPMKDRYVVISKDGTILHTDSSWSKERLAEYYRIDHPSNAGKYRLIKIREVRD